MKELIVKSITKNYELLQTVIYFAQFNYYGSDRKMLQIS
jgi:hypothetical protein